MRNNVVSMRDFAEWREENPKEEIPEDRRHYDDGEKCICSDCWDARHNQKEPDWKSLPLFRDYIH